MLNFSKNAGPVVAADTRFALAAIDNAFRDTLRLSLTLVEASAGSNLPASTSQKVYSSVGAAVGSVLEGRAHLVSTVRHLTAIKGNSVFMDESFGCPEEWTDKKAAAPQREVMVAHPR